MRAIVTLFLFLIIGFVGSRGFVNRAMHRFPLSGILVTGVEFLLLGVALGPHFLGLITSDVIGDLEPMIFLTLGSIGLLVGIEVSWIQIRKISPRVYRYLIVDVAAIIVVVSPAVYGLLQVFFPDFDTVEQITSSAVLGIAASVGSPTVIALVSQILPARGPFTNTARIASALGPLFPLLAFGLLLTVAHPGFLDFVGIGAGLLWWVLINCVGLALGFLMVLFTRERCSDDEMLLLIIGTVLLVGGVCYFLQLSSLYTGLIMGFVVGNFSRKRDQIFRELHVLEKVLFVAFLVIAGATLEFGGLRTLVLIGCYLVLRLVLKYLVAGSAMVRYFPEFASMGRRGGMAFIAQGGIAIAVALDYSLSSSSVLSGVTLTTVAVAVFVTDVAALFATKRVLEASGEVVIPRRERRRRE